MELAALKNSTAELLHGACWNIKHEAKKEVWLWSLQIIYNIILYPKCFKN